MRVGKFVLLITGGVVLFLLFFEINHIQKHHTFSNDTNPQISKDKILDTDTDTTDTTQAQKNVDVFHQSFQQYSGHN